MRKILTTLCLFAFFVETYAVYFKHIGTKEGLSQLSVLAIHQDKLGRMWFGTEEGLTVYDGTSIINYKPTNNTYSENFAVGNKIECITEDKEGNLFFCADNSLYRYDMSTQNSVRIIDHKYKVYALSSFEGNIMIGKSDSVFYLNTKTLEPEFYCQLEHKSQHATSICMSSSNIAYIGTNTGLYLKKKNEPLRCILPDNWITNVFIDTKGNVWISTLGNGVYMQSPYGEQSHFTYESGHLGSNSARSIMEDNNGDIWIGTFQGLTKYDIQKGTFEIFQHSDTPGSITHSSVFPIYKDRQGTIWIGTYYGGVNYFNPDIEVFAYYPAKTGSVSFPYIGHMVEDKDGNVYICTEGGV